MSAPFSFTVRPPSSSSSTAPVRPSPLANGSRTNSSRAGPPSRRLFESGQDDSGDDEDDGFRSGDRSRGKERDDRNGRDHSTSSGSRSSKPAAPLVIPALPNRDWRESSRRVPTFHPEAPKREASDLGTHERIGDGPAKVGLEFFGRRPTGSGGGAEDGPGSDDDVKPEVKQEPDTDGPGSSSTKANGHGGGGGGSTEANGIVKAEPLSLEDQALAELLAGETHKETAEERAQRELVIAMKANENTRILTESEALQRDIHSLPSESTLEDFEAVPISAFGIAALRGMGWDPNSADNVKPREVQRRPQLLGLGATALEVPLDPGKSRKEREREREREKREKKKSRDERTGRGFSAASLLMRTPNGSGAATPANGSSRAGSTDTANGNGYGTGTESDASRRRRRDGEADDGRDSKRRDERDRDRDRDRDRERDSRRYETEEERDRRKARERERYDRGRDRDRDRSDRDRATDRYGERERGATERDRDRQRDYRDRRDDQRDRPSRE